MTVKALVLGPAFGRAAPDRPPWAGAFAPTRGRGLRSGIERGVSTWHQLLKLGQEAHAFLFVRVGAGDDGNSLDFSGVDRQVRDTSGDVDQIARIGGHKVFQLVAPIHHGIALHDVDRRFMAFVQMGLGAATGRDAQDVHADGLRPGGFAGDALKITKPLFAFVRLVKAQLLAGGGHGDRHGGPFPQWTKTIRLSEKWRAVCQA